MPEVTLRRAAQIANALQKKISEIVPAHTEAPDPYSPRRRRAAPVTHRPLAAMVTVDVDTATVEAIDAMRLALTQRRQNLFQLMETYTSIRQSLGTENDKVGVSALVTQRVMLLRQQKILEDLLQEVVSEIFEPNPIRAKIDAVRARLAQGGGTKVSLYGDSPDSPDKIAVPIIGATEKLAIEADLGKIKRQLTEIDDQLISLNSTHKVTVSDRDMDILRNAGLA